MVRVADYIIQRLVEEGIRHIFMITGRGILYLTDAVAKNTEIEGIATYHEQGASYAAMAYAAATDGMSACLVSTGCAATNAVTAALCAYQDNLPVIFISGQHMLTETTRYTHMPIRTFGSQEADIVSIVESVTKYSAMLSEPSEAVCEMDRAVYFANEGRKGPVWIDIPLDIQNARIEVDALKHFEEKASGTCVKTEELELVARELQEARRPVLFIGGGVRSSGAVSEVKKLVERYKIPLVFSTSAADAYGSGNELSIGAVGSLGGSRAGNFAIQNADYILAVGTKLCSQSIGRPEQFARNARIVVVDIDENEHTKQGAKIDRIIHADAKAFFCGLSGLDITIDCRMWTDKCLHWKKIFAVSRETFIEELKKENRLDLYHFADVLSDMISEQTVVITDAGLEELIIPATIRYKNDQRCLFPAAQGAMGYAIPAILGAHYAGKKEIVAVVGDGSFMMNMQELQMIGTWHIPAKIFVINNNMYAVIRKRQKDLFRTRTIGNDPSDGVPAPDFKKVASCFDIDYSEINDIASLKKGIKKVLESDGPCICEVHCVEEQKYLHMSYAVGKNRRLVRRPIEDLSPFLERELFKQEMIIEPVDE